MRLATHGVRLTVRQKKLFLINGNVKNQFHSISCWNVLNVREEEESG